MTPGNPWRRVWRDTVIPVLWLLVAALIVGFAYGAGCTRAGAAPAQVMSPGELYAEDHAADICIALDETPTVTGVQTVLLAVFNTGLSTFETGVAVADSVRYVCPHHLPLLRAFITTVKQSPAREGQTV